MTFRIDTQWLRVPFSDTPADDGIVVATTPEGTLSRVSAMRSGRCIESLELDCVGLKAEHCARDFLDAHKHVEALRRRLEGKTRRATTAQGRQRGSWPQTAEGIPTAEDVFRRFAERVLAQISGLTPTSPRCSFCLRGRSEVKRLVSAPSSNARPAYICDVCVGACVRTLAEHPSVTGSPLDHFGGPTLEMNAPVSGRD